MPVYTYTPTPKNHYPRTLGAVSLGAALLLYAVSSYAMHSPAYVQILALAVATFGIFLITRFTLTSFRYELHDDTLVVVRMVGKNEMMVCNLTLKTAAGIFEKADAGKIREICTRVSQSVNYNVTFCPESYYIYLYTDTDRYCAVCFEPDEAFLAEMKNRMYTPDIGDDAE